jgi:dienelactone hydrolase
MKPKSAESHQKRIVSMVLINLFLCIMLTGLHGQARTQRQNSGNRATDDIKKREAYLKQLARYLPPDRPNRPRPYPPDANWWDWQKRTGELPPDFDAMPSIPFLPDPMILEKDGKEIKITTKDQWLEKRQWIEKEIQHWITGTFPPAPDNLRARIIEETVEGQWTLRTVELRFGPDHRAKMTVDLMIPPGKGPFPVFMTQGSGALLDTGRRNWALTALKRGYIGCVYAGSDSRNDTEADDEDTDPYAVIWPEYDFTSLMRRAWGASRVVDYLYTLPIVDKKCIGITGHSRNGKQSLMAAAFDERITAVIPSSGNTGEGTPWRYTSKKYNNETIRQITSNFPHWFHPRLRFFIGREHKLPVDQNLMLALVAPRGLMLSSSINEGQGNPWGFEQNYNSARKVYQFYGADDNLGLRLRYHGHGTSDADIEAFVDFYDHVFGRNTGKTDQPPRRFYYDYSFEKWLSMSYENNTNALDYPVRGIDDLLVGSDGATVSDAGQWEQKKAEVKERIQWGLGEPEGQGSPQRPRIGENMERIPIGGQPDGGDYPNGNLYYPTDADGNRTADDLPVVIYLHEYAYPHGYGRTSRELGAENTTSFIQGLVDQGYAVFAFDQIGFGTRVEEGTHFYRKYPHWSKMGKMVANTSASAEMLSRMDGIDPERIYVAGYTLGATVGLYTAAMDERIAGVVSVCGFTPMRLDDPSKGYEGIRAWSHLHGLIPRLGFFVDEPGRTPYDFHEILACIAPRPVLVVAPTWDRDADFGDVKACVEEARKVFGLYGAEGEIDLYAPDDYNRLTMEMKQNIYIWMQENF